MSESISDIISKHSRPLLLIVCVLVALAALGSFLSNRQNIQSQRAENALYLARKTLELELKVAAAEFAKHSPVPASPKPTSTPNSVNAMTVDFKKFDVETKLPEALKKLKAVVDEYSKSRAAFEARLNIGDLHFKHGDVHKAIPWYQGAVEHAPSEFDRALALTALGYAYENSNQLTQAIPTYEKALKLKDTGNRGDILLALARSYELNHDVDKARSTYDQILSQLPNTEYSRAAELAKVQLE